MDTPGPSPLATWIQQSGAGVWQRSARQESNRNILEGFSASALANNGALNIARADKANTAARSRPCCAAPLLGLPALRSAHTSRSYRRGSSQASSHTVIILPSQRCRAAALLSTSCCAGAL
jgi:hypothetical protein